MVQAPSGELIDTLRLPTSTAFQLNSLRQVKNSLIGHDQRKEVAVKQGLIDPLVQIISTAAKASGKRALNDGRGSHTELHSTPWTEDDEARLQATIIIGSVIAGGRQFLAPLLAVEVDKLLVTGLTPENPPKLVLATLQAIKNLCISWSTYSDINEAKDAPKLAVFTRESVDVFSAILKQPNHRGAEKQIIFACEIIALAGQDEDTKVLLTSCGMIDTLAATLVSHSNGGKHIERTGDRYHKPPSLASRKLPKILSAIATIIQGSNYRAQRFIYSQPVRDLCLPKSSYDESFRAMAGPKNGLPTADGTLLPPLVISTYKSVSFNAGSSAFPVMSSLDPFNKPSGDRNGQPTGDVDHANAVTSWLLYFARSMTGSNRLTALRLLSLVEAAVSESAALPQYLLKMRERERQSALLAVPLAVKLIQEGHESKPSEDTNIKVEWDAIKEQSCEVLALLIKRSKELQTAAVQANAIKVVCPVLRKSFDNVPLSKPMWSAKSEAEQPNAPLSYRLGSRGLPAEVSHAMKCRLGALEALAALAEKEDVHRKAIVDAGVVSCIIDSLRPFPHISESDAATSRVTFGPKDGNTTVVILAACRAAQMMSRSVSLLRTSLIDAGIAKPIFELFQHPSVEVQVAATDVCANLVLDFSPMRDDLTASGVVQTLCSHVRRSTPRLRLSSLWALKHLMLGASKDMKVSTLEELGTGWLVSAIAGEQREHNNNTQSNGGGVSVALSTANAAGEQVDLLNPSSMDVDEPPTPGSHGDNIEEDDEDEDEDGELMYDEASDTHYHSSSIRSTLQPPAPTFNSKRYLSSIREMEQNPALQAKRDDLAVQEQSLDFLRNLLHGDDCTHMLEHVFHELGHQKVFDLLTAKLSPLSASQRHLATSSTSSSSRPLYNPTELILAALHVMTHIANGSPRHKQLFIAQNGLLRAWLPHFTHPDRRVRVMSVWSINSLTWIEEERDRADARQRTLELRSVGIENAVRALANDPDLDVRERVKTAVRQIEAI